MQKSATPKKKKVTVTQIITKLEKIVKPLIKKRDAYTCQHCLKVVSGTNCQWAHILNRNVYKRLMFDPLNSLVLCYFCHKFFWHSNPIDASLWFQTKFPGRYKYLMSEKTKIIPMKIWMWVDLLQDWIDNPSDMMVK